MYRLVIIHPQFCKMTEKNSLISAREAELAALRAKVAKRREYIDLLELELDNTRGALQEFTDLYNRRIGPLEARQQRLLAQLEKLTADQAPPSNDWRGKRQSGRPGAGPAPGPNGANGHQQDKPFKKKAPNQQDADYDRKVRDLFRRLAKQYHPDLAKDEHQKRLHEEIMSEINQAYSAKNLDALESLSQRQEQPDLSPTPAAELARLTVELRQLETMIFDIEQTIRELDLSPAMQMRSELKADQAEGRDSLSALESEIQARISGLEEQILSLGGELT